MWRLKEKDICMWGAIHIFQTHLKQTRPTHFFLPFFKRSIYLLFMKWSFFCFFFNMCAVFAFIFFFFLLFFYFYKGTCKGFGIRHVGNNACSWCSCFYSPLWANISWVQRGKLFFQGVPGQRPMGFHSSFVCLLH